MTEEHDNKSDSIEVIVEKPRRGRPPTGTVRVDRPKKMGVVFKEAIVRKSISIPESLWKRLRMMGIWENRTDESLVNEALEDLVLRGERERETEENLTKILVERDMGHSSKYKRSRRLAQKKKRAEAEAEA